MTLKRKTVTALKQSGLLITADESLGPQLQSVLARLPAIAGAPIRVERVSSLRDRKGPVHAGSFLRQRRIALACTRSEFTRILIHEFFHFVWLRAGNPMRLAYEELLVREFEAGAHGELGWSADWRKRELQPADVNRRSRRWREYCCESFCDTAAWLYSGLQKHAEFTLSSRFSNRRRIWFDATLSNRGLSI